MELRAYVATFKRRWLALVILPLLALAAVIVDDWTRTPQYTAEARLSIVRVSEAETSEEYEFDDYYDFLVSDFILDDTVEITRGSVFATGVSERLESQGIAVTPQIAESALDASREHRILTIRSTSDDSGLATIIVNAAAIEIRDDYQEYLGAADEALPVTIRPVDVATSASSDSLRVRLTYLIAVVVAGGFGVLLALGLEFFDDRLDGESAGAALGLGVLGVVEEDAG